MFQSKVLSLLSTLLLVIVDLFGRLGAWLATRILLLSKDLPSYVCGSKATSRVGKFLLAFILCRLSLSISTTLVNCVTVCSLSTGYVSVECQRNLPAIDYLLPAQLWTCGLIFLQPSCLGSL